MTAKKRPVQKKLQKLQVHMCLQRRTQNTQKGKESEIQIDRGTDRSTITFENCQCPPHCQEWQAEVNKDVASRSSTRKLGLISTVAQVTQTAGGVIDPFNKATPLNTFKLCFSVMNKYLSISGYGGVPIQTTTVTNV